MMDTISKTDRITVHLAAFRKESSTLSGLKKILKALMVPKDQISYYLVQVGLSKAPVAFLIDYHDRKVMLKAQSNIARFSKKGIVYTRFYHDQWYRGTPRDKVELKLST